MIRFRLNGSTVEADVPEAMPLLWVLRDTLGLTGTKYAVSYTHLTLPTSDLV